MIANFVYDAATVFFFQIFLLLNSMKNSLISNHSYRVSLDIIIPLLSAITQFPVEFYMKQDEITIEKLLFVKNPYSFVRLLNFHFIWKIIMKQ